MKKLDLDNILFHISNQQFRELELRCEIGRLLRDCEIKYMIPINKMHEKLGIEPIEYLRWRNGAVDFSLKQIAKINVLIGDLIREKSILKINLEKKK